MEDAIKIKLIYIVVLVGIVNVCIVSLWFMYIMAL